MQPAALNNKVQLPLVTLSSQPELISSKTEEGGDQHKAKNNKAECKAKKRNRKAKGLELIKNRKFIKLNTHQHCFNYLEAKVKHFEEDHLLHQEALKVKKS